MPGGYRDKCLVSLIKILSDLTVRVKVEYTSEDRPLTYPDSDRPYPFSRSWNVDMMRTGSGWVWNVEKYSQIYDQKVCSCKECCLSSAPATKWAEIGIRSAAHVVFDLKEGKRTTCHLYYDEGSTPETCPGVVTLSGMSRVDINVKEDWCKMTFVTHDMVLADTLEALTKRFMDLQKELRQKYNSCTGPLPIEPKCFAPDKDAKPTLTVIVSHPHGCNKQITIGEYTQREEVRDSRNLTKYTYNTATCPGSSGAPVYILGRFLGWWPCDHPHSGNSGDNKDINFSGVGLH